MKINGRLSFFGGQGDSGMARSEGLALYEHGEADLRPDLFLPRSTDPLEGTSQRLRRQMFYIAIRFPKAEKSRDFWQRSAWKVKNLRNGKWVMCSLVDWGPAEWTKRVVDASYGTGDMIGVKTDDEVEVECLSSW